MVEFQYTKLKIHPNEVFDGEEYVKNKYLKENWIVFTTTSFKKILKTSKISCLESDSGWIFISDKLSSLLFNSTSGIPDLILLRMDGSFKFVEIKNPGDSLSINQMKYYSEHKDIEIIVHAFNIEYSTEEKC